MKTGRESRSVRGSRSWLPGRRERARTSSRFLKSSGMSIQAVVAWTRFSSGSGALRPFGAPFAQVVWLKLAREGARARLRAGLRAPCVRPASPRARPWARNSSGPRAADCADRVLCLFEVEAPHDRRPRDAIARTRAFALRAPHTGDVSEDSDLVGNDASDYSVTKRDADAALAAVDGMTRVLVRRRPILGPGETSIRNSCAHAACATTKPSVTPYPTRPSPGSTSTIWPH